MLRTRSLNIDSPSGKEVYFRYFLPVVTTHNKDCNVQLFQKMHPRYADSVTANKKHKNISSYGNVPAGVQSEPYYYNIHELRNALSGPHPPDIAASPTWTRRR